MVAWNEARDGPLISAWHNTSIRTNTRVTGLNQDWGLVLNQGSKRPFTGLQETLHRAPRDTSQGSKRHFTGFHEVLNRVKRDTSPARMREMAILSGSLCLVCPKSPPPPWLCVLTALYAGAVEDVLGLFGVITNMGCRNLPFGWWIEDIRGRQQMYSSPMASLVLTDSSQLIADGFEKQIIRTVGSTRPPVSDTESSTQSASSNKMMHSRVQWSVLPVLLCSALMSCSSDDLYNRTLRAVAEGRFATDIYQILRKQSLGNLVVSPLSLKLGLAMLYLGARGSTQEQIRHVLHLPHDQYLAKTGFRSMVKLLEATRRQENTTLRLTTRLYIEQRHAISQRFKARAQKYFMSDVVHADFRHHPEDTRRNINYWVRNLTRNTIQDLLSPGAWFARTCCLQVPGFQGPVVSRCLVCKDLLPPGAWFSRTCCLQVPGLQGLCCLQVPGLQGPVVSRFLVCKDLLSPGTVDSSSEMVLVNTLYMKAAWKTPFPRELTSKELFYISSDVTKQVDMMKFPDGEFHYANFKNLDARVLEVPYLDPALSLVVLLPNKMDGLSTLEDKLSRVDLGMIECRKRDVIQVWLPRFTIQLAVDFTDVLIKVRRGHGSGTHSSAWIKTQLGVVDLFDAAVDLSRISPSSPMMGHVVQKSFIQIDEEGTSAAAATAGLVLESFVTAEKVFKADHPFLFFIRENNSRAILFLGSTHGIIWLSTRSVNIVTILSVGGNLFNCVKSRDKSSWHHHMGKAVELNATSALANYAIETTAHSHTVSVPRLLRSHTVSVPRLLRTVTQLVPRLLRSHTVSVSRLLRSHTVSVPRLPRSHTLSGSLRYDEMVGPEEGRSLTPDSNTERRGFSFQQLPPGELDYEDQTKAGTSTGLTVGAQRALSRMSARRPPVLHSSDNSEDDDEDEEDELDVQVAAVEGSYDPSEFDHLQVSPEIRELFQHITR
uniref:Serpin domain-containing protein n=2 Tax=Timema TaxID=61471 RepID=A0A7R9B826_TIMSH|nr:unnamed protein product [Timema shepardi]